MSIGRIVNINGVFLKVMENENGIYMQRVNEDGTVWIDPKPQYTQAEIDSGISLGPVAAPANSPAVPVRVVARRKPWYRRIFGG